MVTCDSSQKLTNLSCNKGGHIALGIDSAHSKETVLGLCSPLRAITGALLLWTLFQVTVLMMLFQSNYLTPHMSLGSLRLNNVIPNHPQSDNSALFSPLLFSLISPYNYSHNNEPIVKVLDDIPYSLPSTGIWYCQAQKDF